MFTLKSRVVLNTVLSAAALAPDKAADSCQTCSAVCKFFKPKTTTTICEKHGTYQFCLFPHLAPPVERTLSYDRLFSRPNRTRMFDKTLPALVFVKYNEHL
jgi:hypothetical protein